LVDGAGRSTPIRLWPSEEPGTFVGRVAVSAGRYDVQVSTDAGASMDQTLEVLDAAAHVSRDPADTDETLRQVAEATGGVAVRADNLAPLESYLRDRATSYEDRVIRPARSPVLLLVFVAAVCAEWTLRRRRGLA
jgi:hypothetical protein